jgi:hypothetical protein
MASNATLSIINPVKADTPPANKRARAMTKGNWIGFIYILELLRI